MTLIPLFGNPSDAASDNIKKLTTVVARYCDDCERWHSGYVLPTPTPSQYAACQRCGKAEYAHCLVAQSCWCFVSPN